MCVRVAKPLNMNIFPKTGGSCLKAQCFVAGVSINKTVWYPQYIHSWICSHPSSSFNDSPHLKMSSLKFTMCPQSISYLFSSLLWSALSLDSLFTVVITEELFYHKTISLTQCCPAHDFSLIKLQGSINWPGFLSLKLFLRKPSVAVLKNYAGVFVALQPDAMLI